MADKKRKSKKKKTEKGTGIPLRMPANTVREDYKEGKLNVQQILRGETPSDKEAIKGEIKLREPPKINYELINKALDYDTPSGFQKNFKNRNTPSGFQKNFRNRKKHGGKIIYKMTGGQVVDASYD